MLFTRCDICGRELSREENRWHGTFELPPKKDEKVHYPVTYSLDVCEEDLDFFLAQFQEFLEKVKYARK